MKMYLKYGAIYITLVLAINLALNFSLQTFLDFLMVAAIVCLPAIVMSILVRIVPKKIFNPDSKLFRVKPKENRLYEKLKIKRWKAKVPEAGKISGFKKDKLYDPKNPEYLRKFLVESCIAEAIHSLSICWGIVSLLLIPKKLILPLGIPLMLFNVFVHIFPVMIQRYIRPKLMRTLNHVMRAAARENQAEPAAELQVVADGQVAGNIVLPEQSVTETLQDQSKTDNQ